MAMRGRPCGRRRLTRPAKLRKRIISPPRHGGKASVWRDRSAIPRAPRALFRFGNVGSFCRTPPCRRAATGSRGLDRLPHCCSLFLIVICAGGMPGGSAQSRAAQGEIRPLVRRPHCYFIVINNGRPVHLLPSSRCQTARSAVAKTRVFLARTARDRRPSGPSPGGRFRIANLCSIITLRSQ